MTIRFNETAKTVPDGSTLLQIISSEESYNAGVCHVVVNGKLVLKAECAARPVRENDDIRIMPVALGG